MKKQITITAMVVYILFGSATYAQITKLDNIATLPAQFVGWDGSAGSTPKPLDIKNNFTGQSINLWTNFRQRMTIVDGAVGYPDGRIGMGNNLPIGFTPLDRLHLAQTVGPNYIRFTHSSSAVRGFQIGIIGFGGIADGNAEIRQTENKNITIWTNDLTRIRIDKDGLVNVLNNSIIPILMKVQGPIQSNAPLPNASIDKTILFGYTNVTGNPASGTDDGFRMKYNRYFQGITDRDALVFEKTDLNLPDPDGATVFTNTGSDGVEELSIMIVGSGRTGIGKGFTMASPTTRPENRLEIDSDPTDPSLSGLRFRNLIATSPPLPGNGKMLTVDSDGDIILVPATGGGSVISGANNGTSLDATTGSTVQFGNDVGLTTAQLLNDREIPMNNFNVFFTDPVSPTATTNRIEIGNYTGLPYNTLAKLSAFNGENSGNPLRLGAFFTSTSNFNLSGIPLQYSPFYFGSITNYIVGSASIAQDNTSAVGKYVGLTGGAYSAVSQNNVGTSGKGYGSLISNYGVSGLAASSGPNAFNYGVSGIANGSGTNYGVYGAASSGVTNRAGYFNGALEYTGPLIPPSDQMFKINVAAIQSATDILRKLKPHTYKFDVINFPQFNFDNVLQYGFIAQEVEPVLPELVHASISPEELDSLGNIIHPSISYKSLNYNALIPITVQAVNEIVARIDKATLSDQNIKTNVQNLTGSLAKVRQMHGVKYEWNSTAQSTMNLDSLEHIGFLAQEIAAIEPLLTFADDSSLMHINYDRVVPIVVESIKELDGQIQEKDSIIAVLKQKDSIMDARMTILENALNACCSSHSMQQNNNTNSTTNSIAQQDVNLKDAQTIILDQNSPNPFAEQTRIDYFLPDNFVKAQMLFYNVQGKLIQSVDLKEKGKCSLNVFAQDLSNGIYTYTLIVDGKVFETKKMVKQ